MLIEEISLKFGASPDAAPLKLESPTCTVFVGPNNSGKSLVLREIVRSCTEGRLGGNSVLNGIRFKSHTNEEAESIFHAWKVEPKLNEFVPAEHAILKQGLWRQQVNISNFMESLKQPNSSDHQRRQFTNNYVSRFILNLDGPSRINLVNAQDRGDLKEPSNSFARIFTDNSRRAKIRDVLHDAFGLYLGFDMSEASDLVLRYGESPPPTERSVEDETLEWMRNARHINELSDGVKAFTGILLELRAGDPRIIAIDEPEAFLHPALAFKLGKEIAKRLTMLANTFSSQRIVLSF